MSDTSPPESSDNPAPKSSGEETDPTNKATEPIGAMADAYKKMSDDFAAGREPELDAGVHYRGSSEEEILFSNERIIEEAMGAPLENPGTTFEEFFQEFEKCRSAVISAHRKDFATWIATHTAVEKRFNRCFLSPTLDVAHLGFDGVEVSLAKREFPTCVILDSFTEYAGRSFEAKLGAFQKSAQSLKRGHHGLIVFVHASTLDRLRTSGKFPSSVAMFQDTRTASSRQETTLGAPVDRLRKLFSPDIPDLDEIPRVNARILVPRTLVQLNILFPDISTAGVDRLMNCFLSGKKLLLKKETEKEPAETIDAYELWKSARSHFEGVACLIRINSGIPSFAFETPEAAALAAEWSWRNADEMFDLFHSVSSMGILFGEKDDSEDHLLFNAYIAAAVELAKRAPTLFNAKWLEALTLDFSARLRRFLPGEDYPVSDIYALLARVSNGIERTKYWNIFARRIATLADALYRDGSGAVVENFIGRLANQGLTDIAILVVAYCGELPDESRLSWNQRFISQGNIDQKRMALRQLCLELSGAQDARPILNQVRHWFDGGDSGSNVSLREAAIAFPAMLFEAFDQKARSKGRLPLHEILDSPVKEKGSDEDHPAAAWISSVLTLPEFGRVSSKYLQGGKFAGDPASATALALYQLCSALGSDHLARGLETSRAVMAAQNLPERIEIRRWWKGFGDHWARDFHSLRHLKDSASVARARTSEKRYHICKSLISS